MDTVQMTLRGVPVEVAEVLRAQARDAGQSLNRYMIDRLTRETETFLHQKQLLGKYRRPDGTREDFEEARRLLDAMRDGWE